MVLDIGTTVTQSCSVGGIRLNSNFNKDKWGLVTKEQGGCQWRRNC